jgi:hypothetical protein
MVGNVADRGHGLDYDTHESWIFVMLLHAKPQLTIPTHDLTLALSQNSKVKA